MAKAKKPTTVYEDPPRKHVLLLTCMDQRLMDDTVRFMNKLNLHNRYDHLILAGSTMGARLLSSASNKPDVVLPWRNVFFDHLVTAIDSLGRQIADIFLIEHLDCGAYRVLHPEPEVRRVYTDYKEIKKIRGYHQLEVFEFAKEVDAFCQARAVNQPAWKGIRVRCFLMDVMGEVEELL